MNDEQLLRYSRHVFLEGVDVAGQQAWCRSRVAVIGVGGLGSIAALLLASAGVGELMLIDPDRVDLSNLPRQIAYDEQDIGQSKVFALANKLRARNSHVQVQIQTAEFAASESALVTFTPHLLLDCTDHFKVRYQVNQFCRSHAIPLVFGAALGWQGQYGVLDFAHWLSPCYHCLYPHLEEVQDSCSQSGVLASVPNVIGSLQVGLALQLLLPERAPMPATLTLWQARSQKWRSVALMADPQCTICGE